MRFRADIYASCLFRWKDNAIIRTHETRYQLASRVAVEYEPHPDQRDHLISPTVPARLSFSREQFEIRAAY
jgi:hypothetical protein